MDSALKALAEPRRREILRLVWTSELPASQIASHFADVTRPAISQHLRVLKDANLLSERREGSRRLYRANRGEVAQLRTSLEQYWMSSLERLQVAAQAVQQMKEM